MLGKFLELSVTARPIGESFEMLGKFLELSVTARPIGESFESERR
jgi:hypothetical protein